MENKEFDIKRKNVRLFYVTDVLSVLVCVLVWMKYCTAGLGCVSKARVFYVIWRMYLWTSIRKWTTYICSNKLWNYYVFLKNTKRLLLKKNKWFWWYLWLRLRNISYSKLTICRNDFIVLIILYYTILLSIVLRQAKLHPLSIYYN